MATDETPGLIERLRHAIGAALGAREHDGAREVGRGEHLREQRRLGAGVDHHDMLADALGGGGDGRHRHALRLVQELVGERGDLLRHGGREEQRLAGLGHLRHDLAHGQHEPEVEHVVGFVEHDEGRLLEAHVAVLHVVEQAAGRGDENVDAARHRLDLRAEGHAADDAGDAGAHVLAVVREALRDLHGELTGGGEDQHAGAARRAEHAVGLQLLEDRQREGGRLAGARLGDAEQVAALEQDRDRLGLDGGGNRIILRAKGPQERLGEAEIRKCCHVMNLSMRRSGARKRPWRLDLGGRAPRKTGCQGKGKRPAFPYGRRSTVCHPKHEDLGWITRPERRRRDAADEGGTRSRPAKSKEKARARPCA